MLALGLSLACSDPPSDSGTSSQPVTSPTLATRPTAAACEDRVAPAEPSCNPDYADLSECATHADCADGDEGTCLDGGSYGLWCVCAYDACHVDADCPGTGVCGCASDPAVQRPTNTCLASDCRVDADCPSGRCQADHGPWCGSADADVVLPVRGWHCTSASDRCGGDSDCDSANGDRCIFDDGAFRCSIAYAIACD
jgi:hypothetical protein